jgi:hypothetical protein
MAARQESSGYNRSRSVDTGELKSPPRLRRVGMIKRPLTSVAKEARQSRDTTALNN